MPDSAVKNVPSVKSARQSRRTGDASAISSTDTDKKLARAARSAQRLAQLSSAPAGDTTLDLFAEDTERATFQAMNTDIRQGTLAGFELPEVFMAAVQSTAINGEAGSGKRAGRAVAGAVVQAADATASLIDDDTNDAAESKRGKAVLAARVVSATTAAAAKRGEGVASDAASGPRDATQFRDGAESTAPPGLNAATAADAVTDSNPSEAAPIDAAAESSASRGLDVPSGSNAGAHPVAPSALPGQRVTSAANPTLGNGAEAVPFAPMHASAAVTARSTLGAASSTESAPSASSAASATNPGASAPAQAGKDAAAASPAAASPHASPASLAAALIEDDRRRTASDAAPNLDRARATAFADTVDALYAVIADQRAASRTHSRRMKTMLTIIVCAMLVTVVTGIAQTLLLQRMTRESAQQQERIEQLMLDQQATLASIFDTDSANIATSIALTTPKESADPSPIRPVNAHPRRHKSSKTH